MLGVVKHHHDLLKDACHEQDKAIADDLAASFTLTVNHTRFCEYLIQRKRVIEMEETQAALINDLQFERSSNDLPYEQNQALKENIKKEIRHIEQFFVAGLMDVKSSDQA